MTWPGPDGPRALVDALQGALRTAGPPAVPDFPYHLDGAAWHFRCPACRHAWTARVTLQIARGAAQPPAAACDRCGHWTDGDPPTISA